MSMRRLEVLAIMAAIIDAGDNIATHVHNSSEDSLRTGIAMRANEPRMSVVRAEKILSEAEIAQGIERKDWTE